MPGKFKKCTVELDELAQDGSRTGRKIVYEAIFGDDEIGKKIMEAKTKGEKFPHGIDPHEMLTGTRRITFIENGRTVILKEAPAGQTIVRPIVKGKDK